MSIRNLKLDQNCKPHQIIPNCNRIVISKVIRIEILPKIVKRWVESRVVHGQAWTGSELGST